MKSTLVIAVILALLVITSAQNFNINCQFLTVSTRYTCFVDSINVPDNESTNFIIGGQHQLGRTNADVRAIDISFSTTPFIITQFFTTFTSVTHFSSFTSGLTRVQTNAFANARSLQNLRITFNPALRTINANAFIGAINLEIMDLWNNQIETIHEAAFTGLASLNLLLLDSNRLQQLHANVFRPLASLEVLELLDNQLQSLDGRLLENNRQIWLLDISRNQVNAIGRAFLDNLPSLSRFIALQNICVNADWRIGGATTVETVRQGLTTCFDNFIEPPVDELRRFIFELRGPLTLRYENGTEIIRV